jgi:hypothetical protein
MVPLTCSGQDASFFDGVRDSNHSPSIQGRLQPGLRQSTRQRRAVLIPCDPGRLFEPLTQIYCSLGNRQTNGGQVFSGWTPHRFVEFGGEGCSGHARFLSQKLQVPSKRRTLVHRYKRAVLETEWNDPEQLLLPDDFEHPHRNPLSASLELPWVGDFWSKLMLPFACVWPGHWDE